MEGRFKCLACGKRGKLKHGFTLWSRCPHCSDYMIVPQQDLALVINADEELNKITADELDQAMTELRPDKGDKP